MKRTWKEEFGKIYQQIVRMFIGNCRVKDIVKDDTFTSTCMEAIMQISYIKIYLGTFINDLSEFRIEVEISRNIDEAITIAILRNEKPSEDFIKNMQENGFEITDKEESKTIFKYQLNI